MPLYEQDSFALFLPTQTTEASKIIFLKSLGVPIPQTSMQAAKAWLRLRCLNISFHLAVLYL